MKQKHDNQLVEVRGTLKSDLQPQAGYGTNVGGMRITIGGPTAGLPAGVRQRPGSRCRSWTSRASKVPGPAAAAECGQGLLSGTCPRTLAPSLAGRAPLRSGGSLAGSLARRRAVYLSSSRCCRRRGRITPGPRSRRAAGGRVRHHALSPRRSVAARSAGAGLDLAAAGEPGRRGSPRRPVQRRDRRHRDRPGHRRPARRHRRDQCRLLPASLRRSGGHLQAEGSARQRHETAARRGRHRPRRLRAEAALRPRGCDDGLRVPRRARADAVWRSPAWTRPGSAAG